MHLRTPRLLLRELTLGDAPHANEYERDPEVVRYQTNDVRTLAESEDYIRRVLAEQANEPRRLFDLAIVRAEDDRYLGRVGLAVGAPDERQAALWYVLDRRAWGNGFAVEAARELCSFGFDQVGRHRIWVDVDPRNTASVRVAERLGFRREAHHLENAFIKGEWTDSIIFAVLAREWPSRPWA